ncbi:MULTISPECIES: hypothetical protein [Sporosarcina]|uniref:hypothetical protein n=1 Tax=Sporosarcina TaxID=1569 RepID=UPI00129B21CC|nr:MULTISPECIES: hypothetical protein [Sporosarcina]GKV67016.1 hypothetical protein NCCP2331_31690 [Sporosarcina sp. NCCP-2331]GLB57346.1 hypothetical protein NCCP2378_31340 [Sporosarcina sp. NCCP-2378]
MRTHKLNGAVSGELGSLAAQNGAVSRTFGSMDSLFGALPRRNSAVATLFGAWQVPHRQTDLLLFILGVYALTFNTTFILS